MLPVVADHRAAGEHRVVAAELVAVTAQSLVDLARRHERNITRGIKALTGVAEIVIDFGVVERSSSIEAEVETAPVISGGRHVCGVGGGWHGRGGNNGGCGENDLLHRTPQLVMLDRHSPDDRPAKSKNCAILGRMQDGPLADSVDGLT